jgi:hypothetical protein
MYGEALSGDVKSLEPFRKKNNKLITQSCLCYFHIYNADETGLFWLALPENTQASLAEQSIPGQKKSKTLSAPICILTNLCTKKHNT